MYRWNQYQWQDVKNLDADIYGDKKANHVIGYHVNVIIDKFFKDESVTFQAQILRGHLTSRKLKYASTLLGISKSTKVKRWRKIWFKI